MATQRRPRFQRAKDVAPIRVTERDSEILRQIYRHRFLRSSQIASLVGGSRQQIVRRLQQLFHHGYVERPPCQIDYYKPGAGSREIAYGLSNRGAGYLKHARKVNVRGFDWNERNRAVRRMFLEHALMTSEVTVAIELACRRHSTLSFRLESEIPLPPKTQEKLRPFQWTVKMPKAKSVGVVPDKIFLIERDGDQPERVLFCLEADRGTMPVQRSNERLSSFGRKLQAYSASVDANIPRRHFGVNRLRVLTVTSTFDRLQNLREAAAAEGLRRGVFLFAQIADFDDQLDPVGGLLWRNSRADLPISLFDGLV